MKIKNWILKNVSFIDYRYDKLIKRDKIYIEDGLIRFESKKNDHHTIDCSNHILMPSFVQLHTHLCQHLYKGLAEDLPLLDWLKKHILPYEQKLDEEQARLSCKTAIYELVDSGTTVILDMGTFGHCDAIMDEIEKSGIWGFTGNILMDRKVGGLSNNLDEYVSYSKEMIVNSKKYFRASYVLCPRFFPGITKKGIEEIKKLKNENNLILHTHASETREENKYSKKEFGHDNVTAMFQSGLLDEKTVLAHCVHLNESEFDVLRKSKTTVAHCPSANLKLGSGIADVAKMVSMGINVGLGSDGAPCNNNMNQINEMRICGLVQKAMNTPKTLPAKEIFKMSAFNGLKALCMDKVMGRIEDGLFADLILLKRDGIHTSPFEKNPFASLIYSTYPSDIDYVFSFGRMLKEKGRVKIYDEDFLKTEKKKALKNLLSDRL